MENTQNQASAVNPLLNRAQQDLIEDMKSREIGAIIWDLSTVGFRFIPEVTLGDKTERVAGLYRCDDTLYLIEEDNAEVDIDNFYNKDTEIKPSVVTLTEDMARKDFGDPTSLKGFSTKGSLEEWLAIADCYFQALTEDNPPM